MASDTRADPWSYWWLHCCWLLLERKFTCRSLNYCAALLYQGAQARNRGIWRGRTNPRPSAKGAKGPLSFAGERKVSVYCKLYKIWSVVSEEITKIVAKCHISINLSIKNFLRWRK